MAKPSSTNHPSPGANDAGAIMFNCIVQIPKADAAKILPTLPVALDCGGAYINRKGRLVEVTTELNVHAMAEIVDKDIPILVTKRIPTTPIPKDMLIDDPDLWFKTIGREK